MPDVGVLNLNIHSDSTEAEQSLDRLAGALSRIKEAVNGAKLSPVASGIRKIADAVNNGISEETISKLGRLSDELSKLKGLGNLNIKITGANSVRDVADTIEEARMSMGAINTGFEQIGQGANNARGDLEGFNNTIRDTMELMQNTAWTGGVAQFRELFEQMDNMRMRMSLPAGEQTGLSDQVEQGWEAWKNGAIEVEGTVTDAMNTVTARLGEPIQYLTGMSSQLGSMNDYLEHSNTLMEDLARNTSAVSSGENAIIPYTGGTGILDDAVSKISEVVAETKEATGATQVFGDRTEETAQKIYKYYNSLEDAFNGIRHGVQNSNDLMSKWLHGDGTAREQLYAIKAMAREFGMTVEEVRQRIAELIAAEQSVGAVDLTPQTEAIEETKNSALGLSGVLWKAGMRLEQLRQKIEESGGAFGYLKGKMADMFPTISGLLKRFTSIAKMRALRYIIRQISSGFSEGVQNVYQYSKAVGTSLAPAMDQAATALQQMKNSIGAAVSPLIQSLVPVLQTVVNWFIEGVNWANQFFALLRGQSTWTRALPESAEAYEKNSKAAKKASKDMKDLLADWDELNVIQSQNNGGSGSGTGKTAEEYKNMFEEVSEFSDSVKDTLSIIENSLGGLPGILAKAGAVLLGWKFSKAFTGILGKLGKVVAGGALVTIGVEIAYGSGFDAGLKGGFGTTDIIGAIGGSLAAGIGGSLLASTVGLSGPVGFAIGVGVAVVATLYGYMKGNAKGKDAVKWGNLHYTAEEVKKYVRDQFTFDVDAEISALHTNINNIESAKAEADQKIAEFEKTLNEAKVNVSMGVDADPNGTTVKDAIVSAQAAIAAVQSQITATNTGLEVGLKYLPYINESVQDDSENFLKNIMIDEKPITDYMNEMGRELAEALYAGEKAGWDEKTTQAALDLLKSQQEMWNEYKQLSKQYELDANLQETMNGVVKDGVIDKETAQNALQEQENILSEYTEAAMAEAEAEAASLRDLAAKAQAMANRAMEQGNETAAKELEDSAKDLLEQANSRVDLIQKSVDAKLAETKENISKQWIELIRKVYGEDIDTSTTKYTAGSDRDSFIKYVLKGMNEGGIGKASENMISTIANMLGFTDLDWLVKNLLNDNVVSVFDLLGKETREALFHSLEEQFGTDTAYDIFRTAFDLTRGDIDLIAFPEGNIPENINDDLENAIEEYIDLDAEAEVPITITPVIDMDETNKELKKHIDYFLSDELLAKWELDKLYEKFGQDLVTKTLENMGLELEEADLLPNGDYQYHMNGSRRPAAIVAANAMSPDYGKLSGRGYDSTPVFNAEPMEVKATVDDQNFSDDVEAGTRRANADQNELIQQLISLATRIANKEFVVHLNPDSTWADHNARSAAAMGRITG